MMADTEPHKLIRKPPWLKIKPNFGPVYAEVKALLKELNLHTVCQEASCPNIGECFSARTATFIILGDKCTRNCRFCDVGLPGDRSAPKQHRQSYVRAERLPPPDGDEPARVALAVRSLKLRFAVITSVSRDDLADAGAGFFAETIRQIRKSCPECKIEVLIPDLNGDHNLLDIILDAGPDVLAHNVETAPALYPEVRHQADYRRSLGILEYSSKRPGKMITKSGMMVGLGENMAQIKDVLQDIASVGCQIFTVGQYLAPSKNHFPVQKYYRPEEFDELKKIGEKLGIPHVESGPLVRSSYMAHRQAETLFQKNHLTF